jgi:WD40 repeat protein
LTFGFENVRIWRPNPDKAILQGSSFYLGQTNRKVTYRTALVQQTAGDTLAWVGDSNGFLTVVSVGEVRMLESFRVDSVGVDCVVGLGEGRAVVSNEEGRLRGVGLGGEILEELEVGSRVRDMWMCSQNELELTHFTKAVGRLQLDSGVYSFLVRCHSAAVTHLAYSPFLNKLVSASSDCTIRVWSYLSDGGCGLPNRLQEQYEFVITGEAVSGLATGQ